MSKTCYSDYVAHCLRFYCRTQQIKPDATLLDHRNWEATDRAMMSMDDPEREIIRKVYTSGENTNDSIRAVSAAVGMDVDRLWSLVKRTERRVAEERGLA